MAKQVQKFVDDNGTEFNTEAEADASNAFIKAEFTIEAYIEEAGLKMAQAGLMRTHIAGYLAFADRDDVDGLVEAAKVRVTAEKAAKSAAAAAERAAKKAAAGATA